MKAVTKWERVISDVATQEMLHLSLVNNMLTAIGAATLLRPSEFSASLKLFSAEHSNWMLLPFGEEALRQFLYLERAGWDGYRGVPGWEAIVRLPEKERGRELSRSSSIFPRLVISIGE